MPILPSVILDFVWVGWYILSVGCCDLIMLSILLGRVLKINLEKHKAGYPPKAGCCRDSWSSHAEGGNTFDPMHKLFDFGTERHTDSIHDSFRRTFLGN